MAGRLEEAYRRGDRLARGSVRMARRWQPNSPGMPRSRSATRLELGRPSIFIRLADLTVGSRRQPGCSSRPGSRALEGDRAGAVAGYRAAIAAYRALDLRLLLGLALSEYAVLARPDQPEADAVVEEARAIFTALGSPPLLDRLEIGLAGAAAAGDRGRVADGAVDTESVEHAVESTAG